MRIIIGCERSGIVREQFRLLGHDAWSCDLEDSDDNSPYHYKCSILDVLHLNWDMAIFHPPCTYMSKVGAPSFNIKRYGEKAKERLELREDAIKFFLLCKNQAKANNIKKVCLENPTPFKYVTDRIGKYNQAINPWQFGDQASKRTCLWLYGLPHLIPTKVTKRGQMVKSKNGTNAKWYIELAPNDRQKIRSQTFPGIAQAMAIQWGSDKYNELTLF